MKREWDSVEEIAAGGEGNKAIRTGHVDMSVRRTGSRPDDLRAESARPGYWISWAIAPMRT